MFKRSFLQLNDNRKARNNALKIHNAMCGKIPFDELDNIEKDLQDINQLLKCLEIMQKMPPPKNKNSNTGDYDSQISKNKTLIEEYQTSQEVLKIKSSNGQKNNYDVLKSQIRPSPLNTPKKKHKKKNSSVVMRLDKKTFAPKIFQVKNNRFIRLKPFKRNIKKVEFRCSTITKSNKVTPLFKYCLDKYDLQIENDQNNSSTDEIHKLVKQYSSDSELHTSPKFQHLTVIVYWWGYELYLPKNILSKIEKNKETINSTIQLVGAFLKTIPVLQGVIGIIEAYIKLQFQLILNKTGENGTILASTWAFPLIIVPKPWDNNSFISQ